MTNCAESDEIVNQKFEKTVGVLNHVTSIRKVNWVSKVDGKDRIEYAA